MTTKSKYKTKQQEEILVYLREVEGEHVTVADILAHFKDMGNPIGTATVYRHLEKMVDEGIVNKYSIDGTSSACFEYIGSGSHSSDGCFHYKCEKCGKLVHLHCDEFKELAEHLSREHNFKLNPMRTVFYGICKECREENDDR